LLTQGRAPAPEGSRSAAAIGGTEPAYDALALVG
jgi:hypothetical protein